MIKGDEGNLSFYKQDDHILEQIKILKKSIDILEKLKLSVVTSSEYATNAIADINRQLETLLSFQHVNINSESVRTYKDNGALENQLLDGNYVAFDAFSTFENVSKGKAVDDIFGLYSPISVMSPKGICWLIQQLIVKSREKDTEETFILIEFFGCKVPFTRNETLKEAIDAIPPSLRSELKEEGGNSIQDSRKLFMYCVKLLGKHFTSSRHLLRNINIFEQFFQVEELLSTLCYTFLENSLNFRLLDAEFLHDLLCFVKQRHWKDNSFIIGGVIAPLCRQVQDLGLSRWEYYLGMNEEHANPLREIWWDTYWWDKWYVVVTGKLPMIDSSTVTCLLPQQIMRLGVDDAMSSWQMLERVDFTYGSLKDHIMFGYIVLSISINDVFSNVLYNRKFTDYRVFSGITALDFKVVEELLTRINGIRKGFTVLKTTVVHELEKSLLDDDVFRFCIHFAYSRISCLRAIGNLLMRFKSIFHGTSRNLISDQIGECDKDILQTTVETFTFILRANDNIKIKEHVRPISEMGLNILLEAVKAPAGIDVYHISLFCGVASLFDRITCSENGAEKQYNHPGRIVLMEITCIFIFVRVCCLVYRQYKKVSKEELMAILTDFDHTTARFCNETLDIRSDLFQHIIRDKKKSDYHRDIIHGIEKVLGRDIITTIESCEREVISSDEYRQAQYMGNVATKDLDYLRYFLNLDIFPELNTDDELWDDLKEIDKYYCSSV
ncbi:AEL_HP2_G0041330.mRNA.1.CDS.1 [Saccharomyces cerevisiae]|nr:AEL_HP2_G0041330.mRNA.1.CDS.1 [Saccharomyces cerevisiae]CAI6673716.1 AEL_HP2_G0041330.mRNA.1.CDS.1 [Saccharomyces cerevisiae]